MLRWRLTLGAMLIAALAGLVYLDEHAATPGTYLFPLALVLAPAASAELLALMAARSMRPNGWVVNVGNLLIASANLAPLAWGRWLAPRADPLGPWGWPAAALAVALLAVMVSEMKRYTAPGQVTESVAAAMLAMVYVGLLLSFVVALRLISPATLGTLPLVSLVIVVKMGDTGAYAVGRFIGRHKLAPVLSPKKTIEGALGGLAFACLGAWAALNCLAPAMSGRPADRFGAWLSYGLLVGVAGMLGDLAESLLKRDLGSKDSSAWMPGFGGLLDLLDSILFAAPVAYLAWVFGLV